MSSTRLFAVWNVVWPPMIVFALAIGGWQLGVSLSGVASYLLPGPVDVASAAWNKRVDLLNASMLTALAASAGFLASLLIGVGLSIVFSMSRWLRSGCYPYAIVMQTVPVVAVAPLIVVWFGYGLQSVVLVAFIISLFPIITSTTSGLLAIDRDLLDLFELHNASRFQKLRKLSLPSSIPYILAGSRISAGMAVIGAIVGEFFLGLGAQRFGLGYLILQASNFTKTDELFAAVLASTGLGVAVFLLIQWSSETILSRWQG